MYRAPSFLPAVVLAVTVWLVVATGLARQYHATRTARRELDDYLRWLLTDASGPVRVAVPYPWPSA